MATRIAGLTLDADGCFTDAPSKIATWSGGRIDPLAPAQEDLRIEDVARGLANACRWNGQCPFYSVAEHSVLISYMVPTLEALMHDASEGLGLNDMARPIKIHTDLGELYLEHEAVAEQAIAQRWKLTWPWPPEVKAADYAMGFAEAKVLVPHLGKLMPPVDVPTPALRMWSPDEAYSQFLVRYLKLGGKS